MKKLIAFLLVSIMVLTLSACDLFGGGGEVDCLENPNDPECQQIVDCLVDPDDPSCEQEVDCTVTPDDPECEVDCTVTPNDPACEVDCTVTPNDPACQVDCTVTPNDPACEVDCTVTPNDPACEVDCTVTPNDPECVVDCTVTPNDPECVVDCTVTPNDPACAVDCTVTPDDPECDVRTPEEKAVDAIIDNWNTGETTHIGVALALMDFSTGFTMTQAFNLEITEDIDEIHIIDASIIDKHVYNEEVGTMIQRDIYLNMDDEFEVEFTIYMVEVPTGVHIYLQPGMIFEAITEGDPQKLAVLNTLGFNNEWAVFKFDDSLENVIQLEVLKEMIVTLFFNEMGEDFFDVLQAELEAQIGFELDQYGVDFALFIDYLIAEDFANAELLLQGVQVENIVLHLDYMYLAWRLYDFLGQFTTELEADGFDVTKLEKLNTATYSDTVVTIDYMNIPSEWWNYNAQLDFEGFDGTQTSVGFTFTGEVGHDYLFKIEGGGAFVENGATGDGTEQTVTLDLSGLTEAQRNGLNKLVFFVQTGAAEGTVKVSVDVPTTGAVLMSSDWVGYGEIVPSALDVNLPVDPLGGTLAFLESLTEAEVDSFVEIVLKPTLEAAIYNGLLNDVYPEYLDDDFIAILSNYEDFLMEHWPEESDPFVLADAVAFIQANGAVEYYRTLTEDEFGIIHWAVDHHNNSWVVHELRRMNEEGDHFRWFYVRYEEEVDLYWLQEDVRNFVFNNQSQITTAGYDPVQFENDINNQGIIDWYNSLDEPARQMLLNLVEQPGNEYARDQVWLLHRIYENPWEFQNYFRSWDDFVDNNWITYNLINLISNHTTFLNDEYGMNGTQMIADIEMYGGVEWYLYQTDEFTREVLNEISYFDGDQHEGRYVVDNMERVFENQWEYFWWFGRAREMHDVDQMHHELMQFLQMNQNYIETNYPYDVNNWMNDVEMYGPIEWFNTLTEEQMNNLEQVAQMNEQNNEPYGWIIYNLRHLNRNAEQYSWCFGEWNYCQDMEHLTQQLIQFVQDNGGMFENEFGMPLQDIIDEINMYGAMDWFNHHIDQYHRELMMEMADNYEWAYDILWRLEDILYQEQDLHDFLTSHASILDGYGFDTTQMIADLELYGIQVFVADYLSPEDIEMIVDAYVYPIIEGFLTAIENDEIQEYVVQTLFTNPHILAEFQGEPVFETDTFLANIVLIDFDAMYIELDTFDVDALATAVYEGQAAFDLYITGLETTHPNLALLLEPYRAGVLELEAYMFIIDDIEYILTNMEPMMAPYMTLEFYMDNEMMAMELIPTDDFELITRMSMSNYDALVESLLEDVYWFLYGIQALDMPYMDPINCPVGEECEVMEGYDQILANLALLDPFMIDIQFDPTDLNNYSITFNATELLDSIVQIDIDNLPDDYVFNEYDDRWTGVTNATFSITMEEGAVITPPATADSVNDILIDFAKFTLVQSAYEVLQDLSWYYEENPGMLSTDAGQQIPISNWDEEFLQFTAALDKEMSYTELSYTVIPPTMDFEIQFYWLDGTEVFDAPLTWVALASLFVDGEVPDAGDYQALVDMVDEDNFNLTKLWLYYMMGNTGTPDYDDDFYN